MTKVKRIKRGNRGFKGRGGGGGWGERENESNKDIVDFKEGEENVGFVKKCHINLVGIHPKMERVLGFDKNTYTNNYVAYPFPL